MEKELPKILYKYRSWQEHEKIEEDKKYQKRFLTKSEIFFASVLKLNDPFELRIPNRYDLLTDDEIVIHNCFHILRENSEQTGTEIVKKAFEAKDKFTREKRLNATLRSLESYRTRYGILSLTEDPLNIIMWTHYANNHKGFCIGYNLDKLKQLIISQTDKYGISAVSYTRQLPAIIPTLNLKSRFDNITNRVTTKSIEWSFEKEFRIVISEPDTAMTIPSDIVEEIVLGCNISNVTEEEIIKLKNDKYPDSKLIKLEPDSFEYKLNIKE